MHPWRWMQVRPWPEQEARAQRQTCGSVLNEASHHTRRRSIVTTAETALERWWIFAAAKHIPKSGKHCEVWWTVYFTIPLVLFVAKQTNDKFLWVSTITKIVPFGLNFNECIFYIGSNNPSSIAGSRTPSNRIYLSAIIHMLSKLDPFLSYFVFGGKRNVWWKKWAWKNAESETKKAPILKSYIVCWKRKNH